MGIAFLIYMLCAMTDCPAPMSRSATQREDINQNILTVAASSLSEVRQGRSRSFETGTDKSNRLEVVDATYFLPIPVATTSLGEFHGKYMESRGGRLIAAFQGIPYARPPVGNLRFHNPLPIRWPTDGAVFIANKTRSDCLQMDMTNTFRVRGQEDCLYLNIYVPEGNLRSINKFSSFKNRSGVLLPVLVFIHGGGWMSHSSKHYGPKYLLDKDVILITFNFRLGVLGFLSTGDSSAPGNFGLKDQVLALKWIADHIKDFGGDPKKITLMGESTGAGATALHLLSPLTAKAVKMQGAILLSGSSLNHWGLMNDTFDNTKLLAQRMHCPVESSQGLVQCLRTRDPYLVVGQQLHLWIVPLVSRLLFGPVLESSVDNPAPFLVEAPEVTYSRPSTIPQPVPVISGFNMNEGAMFAANVYLIPFLFRYINANFDKMASFMMAYDKLKGVNTSEVSSKISKFYFHGVKWSANNLDEISNVLGDRTITTGVHKFLQSHSPVASTYGYFFTELTGSSLFLSQMGIQRTLEWGVSHGDELPFIFSMEPLFQDLTDKKHLELSEFMVNVVTNFVRDRQPLPENKVDTSGLIWSPVINAKYMELLEIRSGKKRMIPFPYSERMKFWENLNLN